MPRRENKINRELATKAKRENALKAEAENKEKRLKEEKKRKDDAEAKQKRQKQLEACRSCMKTNNNCKDPCEGIKPIEINRLTKIDIEEIKKKLGMKKLKF